MKILTALAIIFYVVGQHILKRQTCISSFPMWLDLLTLSLPLIIVIVVSKLQGLSLRSRSAVMAFVFAGVIIGGGGLYLGDINGRLRAHSIPRYPNAQSWVIYDEYDPLFAQEKRTKIYFQSSDQPDTVLDNMSNILGKDGWIASERGRPTRGPLASKNDEPSKERYQGFKKTGNFGISIYSHIGESRITYVTKCPMNYSINI